MLLPATRGLLRRGLSVGGRARGQWTSIHRLELSSEAYEPLATDASTTSEGSSRNETKKAEMLAAFTCNKCGARTGRAFSKVAYQQGVVIARCGNCNVQHLISDQLGWFGEKSNIEDILREKGEQVRKGEADGVLNVTPEDLEAWSQSAAKRKS